MSGRSLLWMCLGAAVIAALPAKVWADGAPTAKAVVQQYCIGCHNARLKTAGLVLDPAETERVGQHPDTWEKVARKLRTGEMPPAGLPRPNAAAYRTATLELESALDQAAAQNP